MSRFNGSMGGTFEGSGRLNRCGVSNGYMDGMCRTVNGSDVPNGNVVVANGTIGVPFEWADRSSR